MREAGKQKEKPEDLKKELQEIIELEDDGPLSKALKLKKKVLQEAFDAAIKRGPGGKKVRAAWALWSACTCMGMASDGPAHLAAQAWAGTGMGRAA